MRNKALLLDRDGVINHTVEHPREGGADSPYCLEDFTLIEGAAEAIAAAREQGYLAIVVSNQPGIAKGRCDQRLLDALTARMVEDLAERGAQLDAVYYCLHHPDAVDTRYRVACDCRKPRPGLLLRAAREHDLDLSACIMVGDHERDVMAGRAVGCRTALIQSPEVSSRNPRCQPDVVASDLGSALRVLNNGGHQG